MMEVKPEMDISNKLEEKYDQIKKDAAMRIMVKPKYRE